MTQYTLYRPSTGEIITSLEIFGNPDEDYIQVEANCANNAPDCASVEGYGETGTHYVAVLGDRVIIADRPDLIVIVQDEKTTLQADGIDSITLTGLPNPCDIIIDDPDPDVETQTITVTGGGFIFTADDPGVYTVEVRRWPFMPFKIEFTAI